MASVTKMTADPRGARGDWVRRESWAAHNSVARVAAPVALLASFVGCGLPEVRQQVRAEDLHQMERKLDRLELEKEARNQPAAPVASAERKPDKPPRWRPVQAHVAAGPVFRLKEPTGKRAALSVARVWSRPHAGNDGSLSGAFAGVGVEGTAEDRGVTLGPVLRVGTAAGEYVYPGVNSPDLYTYGQLVPFVGIRDRKMVTGLRLGGGLTVPGFLRSLLGRNHQTEYADSDGFVDGGAARAIGFGIGKLLLVPVALVNHLDGNVEVTSTRDLSAGVAVGSDPSELVAPLH
jgi:hypothetical protein